MKTFITLLLIGLSAIALVTSNAFLSKLNIRLHSDTFINGILQYQIFALLLAILVCLVTLKANPNSKELLSFGNLNEIASKEIWMGINGKTSWLRNGVSLLLFISFGTGIFMYGGLEQTQSLDNFKWGFIPYIILFSASNAFSEELIFRIGINGNLQGYLEPKYIFLISAVMFGLPHWGGNPSGPVGVIMAGVLGYILSKATHETKGIGLALIIHFVQDIIIFTAVFMMNNK
ncbi:MAG: CPBP family intramembrane glutamic endopeptidase [Spirosomataceae bacterium]